MARKYITGQARIVVLERMLKQMEEERERWMKTQRETSISITSANTSQAQSNKADRSLPEPEFQSQPQPERQLSQVDKANLVTLRNRVLALERKLKNAEGTSQIQILESKNAVLRLEREMLEKREEWAVERDGWRNEVRKLRGVNEPDWDDDHSGGDDHSQMID